MNSMADAIKGATTVVPKEKTVPRRVAPAPPPSTTMVESAGIKIPALPQRRIKLRTVAELQERRTARQAYRDEIAPFFHDTFRFIADINAMDEEDWKLNEAALRENQELLEQVLRDTKGTDVEDIAIMTYADALIHDIDPEGEEAEKDMVDVFEDLVELGFLEVTSSASHDALRIASQGYLKLTSTYDDTDGLKVIEALKGKMTKVLQLRSQERKRADQELRQKLAESGTSLTLAELLSQDVPGKEGEHLAVIPEIKLSSSSRILPGGSLMFRRAITTGYGGEAFVKISLIQAGGDLMEFTQNIMRSIVYLRPDQMIPDKIMINPMPRPKSREGFMELVHQTYNLRHLLRRAEQELGRQEDRKNELAEFQAKATISCAEAFLDGKAGVAFCDFGKKPFILERRENGKSTGEKQNVWKITYVFERREDGQVRIVCPGRLNWFFQKAQEWVKPGDKFGGVAYPGNVLLRAEYAKAQTQRASQPVAEGASQPTEEAILSVVDTTAEVVGVARRKPGRNRPRKPSSGEPAIVAGSDQPVEVSATDTTV